MMSRLNLTSFPALATERLTLRRLKNDDAGQIFLLRSDEAVNRYIDREKAVDINDAGSFIDKINNYIDQGASLYWAVCRKEDPELIGTICLWNFSEDNTSAELGYELLPAWQGRGLMDEALKAVLAYGFQQPGFREFFAYTHKENRGSEKLLQKNEFVLYPAKKEEGDLLIYHRPV